MSRSTPSLSSGSSSPAPDGSASTISSAVRCARSTQGSWSRKSRHDRLRRGRGRRGRSPLRSEGQRRRPRSLDRSADSAFSGSRGRAERQWWGGGVRARSGDPFPGRRDPPRAAQRLLVRSRLRRSWLLRPLRTPEKATAELNVSTPQDLRFVAGLPRGPISASELGDLPYAAFGDLRVETGLLTVAVAKVPRRQSEEELLGWIRESAALIERYFGRFPADGALLLVLPARGHEIHGRCRGTGGASILFPLGTEVDLAEARRSWELVHEMVHLGFPSLARRHLWVEEGLATYVEPIARARVGELSARKVWGDLVRGLPQGLPRQGDEGLDRTHTWGRTYWGGALFWLLADVEIRERTGNRFGLEDALRAVLTQRGKHRGALAASARARGWGPSGGNEGAGRAVCEDGLPRR